MSPTSGSSGLQRDPGLAAAFGFDLDDDSFVQRLREVRPEGRGQLGDYELLAVLGHGAQGLVYKARQPKTGRFVALKRLSAGSFATPDMRARFFREIEVAAALDHPGIVTVYGAEHIEHQPVLVMQWIDGVPLDRWRCSPSGQPHPLHELLVVFAAICDAVHHAHQRGVLHRDLKPSNILVDAEAQPHVLDFGLAKLQQAGEHGNLTQTGTFLGTPAYAPPEAFRDARSAGDVRSDVYSLGVILFELITGRLPFDVGRPISEVLALIQNDPPVLPSRLAPGLSHELDAIVMKSLAKAPDERYSSVEALAADVRRHIEGRTVLAMPPSRIYRARKFVKRHRWMVAGTAVVGFSMLAASIVSSVLYLRAEQQRRRAEGSAQAALLQALRADREAAGARRETRTAKSFGNLLRDTLQMADPSRNEGNPRVTVREAMDAALQALEQPGAPYEPEAIAAMLDMIGTVYNDLGLAGQAQPLLERALRERVRTLGPDHPDTAETRGHLAGVLDVQGEYRQAEEIWRRALASVEHALGSECESYAELLNALGTNLRLQGRPNAALAAHRDALALRRKLLGDQHPDTAASLGDYAFSLREAGEMAEAERLDRSALAAKQAIYGAESLSVARAKRDLAAIVKDRRDFDEAERLCREAVETCERLLPDDHPTYLNSLSDLAVVIDESGRPEMAEPIYRGVLEKQRKLYGENNPMVATAMNNVAAALVPQSAYPEALELLEQVLRLRTEEFGPGGLPVAQALHNLAVVYFKVENYEQARAYLTRAMDIRCRVLGGSHRVTALTLYGLATCLLETGETEAAESLLAEVVSVRERILPAGHRHTPATRREWATALLRLGRHAQALEQLELAWQEVAAGSASDQRLTAKALADLHEAWQAADPLGGHEQAAVEWRARAKAIP